MAWVLWTWIYLSNHCAISGCISCTADLRVRSKMGAFTTLGQNAAYRFRQSQGAMGSLSVHSPTPVTLALASAAA